MHGKDFFVRAEFGREEVMKITGTVTEEEMRVRGADEGGLDNRSGMRFWAPLICCTEKSYLENHVLRRRRCLSGSVLFFKLIIFRKEELSNLTIKLC